MDRLTEKRCNGIKSGYWTTAKKDELVQQLGRYEDSGLMPEEIMPVRFAHWVTVIGPEGRVYRICSNCHSQAAATMSADGNKFCDVCGARMVEDDG